MADARSAPETEPIVSETHPTLFHYTTETGLYGILRSQQLWATHFSFMNDSQESLAARDILHTVIENSMREKFEPFFKEGKIAIDDGLSFEEACRGQAGQLLDVFYKTSSDTVVPFISSFCFHTVDDSSHVDGLLSQWRGYGRDGGFALEFETSELEKLMKEDSEHCTSVGYYLVDVIYGDKSGDFALLQNDMDKIATAAVETVRKFAGLREEEPDVGASYFPFMKCTTRVKHDGFKEEQEVRLVHIIEKDFTVTEGKPSSKEMLFRNHRGSQVPYLQLFGTEGRKLPIGRIIIGPHPRAELRRTALQLYLEQAKIEATVHVSAIPYLPE